MSEKILTAIDLGSSKICAVIAALHDNDKLEIKGVSICESKGVENGLVRDLQKTAESITEAIEMAEQQAKVSVDNIFVAISGQHIKSRNAVGRVSVAIGNQASEIEESHIDSVINDAKNSIKMISGTERLEILHCIPQIFDIDSQTGILNPIGMSGFSMTVHTHLILAEASHLRNIRKAFDMAGFEEPTIVLGAIATAEAVTNDDERRLGCIVLDIGGGTSDLSIYQGSCLNAHICIPKGGALITQDIAVGLRTPPQSAEHLKIEYGNAVPESVNPQETADVEGIGGRAAQKKSLALIAEISQIRVSEILDTCYKEILAEFTMLDTLTAGMIFTGGTSLIKNIHFLVENENGFNLPCKIGYPNSLRLSGAVSRLDSPIYACVIGLLYYAVKNEHINSRKKINFNVSDNFSKFFKNIIKKLSEL